MGLLTKRWAICLAALAVLMAGCNGGGDGEDSADADGGPVTLTFLVDDTDVTVDYAEALTAAFTEDNPNVTFEIETRPGGGEGDNLVKTRLATGEMADLFWYNSGSLFQALNPTETIVDLSDEPFVDNIVDSFLPTVSADEGTYGVPVGTALGGGILYNKKIYEDLGLSVPKTWAEFASNNEAIKEAGIAPVGQTYTDTWTSQLFVLADYHNVQAQDSEWAEKYTNNQTKYVDQPALTGFQRLEEGFEKDWYQKDFGSATYEDGLNLLAEGEIAHYPMLSFAIGAIEANNPDAVQDIGFFGQPSDDAATNGATIWMPAGIYIAATSDYVEEAKAFLAFVASVEGTDVQTEAVAPQGPYMIEDATLPEDTLPAVLDIQAYIDAGNSTPALEFLSPIKGPQLEHLTVEVGSGLRSAEEAAALYDEDVKAQAQQLGLPGW